MQITRIQLQDTLPWIRQGAFDYFQQDGASLHFTIDVPQYLDHRFPHRWIGRGSPIRWTVWSPDLPPLNFFLRDHFKNIIYKTSIKDMTDGEESTTKSNHFLQKLYPMFL